ncbi:hypothetical protein [Cellulophaga sp. HaHa_2_1]|uniref:hypothetical protein n=1 Tax=Cellulophaga sp. HaHa_2_1 TaxID=2749994 RepID=UPI001C4E6BEF|nr:hypothetical protein [Cellulophaga sp. HaHa_2_1]QXP53219.1 hypothetical protein H0I24_04595 [Cellulophaga sp. HaHa_2_1]
MSQRYKVIDSIVPTFVTIFPGAIIIFSHSHVAFVYGETENGERLVYLGGNQGDGTISGAQQIKYGTVTIGNEYAIMKPIKYTPSSYELPEMNKNEDGSYASTH